jgi:hypothetical protein
MLDKTQTSLSHFSQFHFNVPKAFTHILRKYLREIISACDNSLPRQRTTFSMTHQTALLTSN